MQLIFEKSKPGRRAAHMPPTERLRRADIPPGLLRDEPADLPEVTELDTVRHFTRLSRMNFSVDTHFYPLGSCTMKYNPRACEAVAALPGFTDLHPLWPQLRHGGLLSQGALELLYTLERTLTEITGMAEFTLQPMAGSHGELTGAMIMAAYHRDRGNEKDHIIVPDSSHGTNPASAAIAGYRIVTVPSDDNGVMDMARFRETVNERTAGLMLTCPNTMGVFNPSITEISEAVHEVDGLMYYDGANLNALLGRIKPGRLGFDICHLNMHKTFSTPHGGGGPGAGPVGVTEKLRPFLPISRVVKTEDGTYRLNYQADNSIGYIAPFYGNFGVLVRAFAYLLLLGSDGLREISNGAVLNANYLLERLRPHFKAAAPGRCMHECVFEGSALDEAGITTLDLAKALLDRGFHPPTVYFPLNVPGAIMIEPTETESCETLDAFADAMIDVLHRAREKPEPFREMPRTTPVSRLDEVAAARDMKLTWEPESK